ncbi:hypothetical protein N7490_001328 [Penicillium lividum]|nr:hypothetical protein N7490_001328 [Penicillium lividum]
MSVGFGFSVGDFIAALELVGTVIDALRESSEATSSMRTVINELYALESALLHVKRLDTGINQINLTALRQAASQCQLTVTEFYRKIQKYQVHMQQGGMDSRKRRQPKLKRISYSAKGLASRIQDLSCKVMGQLSTITRDLAESIQQGKALIESSAQVAQTNLRVFQIVHDIQLAIFKIPGQIRRQQPIRLTDPFNRESPFHLEFVRSPEALLAVLKNNLKSSGCGPAMID